MRQNNQAVIAKSEPKVTKGGNIAKYNELLGEDKSTVCAEFTFPQFEGTTGQEFVALQLAMNAEEDESLKDSKAMKEPAAAADATDDAPAPVQPNGMDAGESDLTKPPTTEGEAAKDKAAKDPNAAKDPKAAKDTKTAKAGAPTKPIYSPILDEDVSQVGICNKAHPKTVNVIQVLYVKQVTNALV